MLYELRIYKIAPGRNQDIFDLFKYTNLDNFKRIGIEVCGLWTSVDEKHNFYYLLKFDSEADKKEKWEAFYADAGWQQDIAKFQELGDVVQAHESYLMENVPFFENKC